MQLVLIYVQAVNYTYFFFLWYFGPLYSYGLSFHEASIYHSDTLNSVEILRASDQSVAETST